MITSPLVPSRIRRLPSVLSAPQIAAVTAPLDALLDHNVLVLADDENLVCVR